ncbi:vacuolar sorting protein, partial [Ramaria rubella]
MSFDEFALLEPGTSLEARLTVPLPSLSEMPDEASQQDEQHTFYRHRAKDFVELHEQVETSVGLLDSLESFLSTFQHDLSAVSGQISDLQGRSKDIESRLKGRRKIERPLSNLISEISISPVLAETILDSDVGEPWLVAIPELESRLNSLKARPRVKAARGLAEVAEGLRIVAATKIRAFFLMLFQPIRNNISTNMQVIQTSVLLKFRLLFLFLHRHATPVAIEVQSAYIAAARLYYETGFRRYARSLGWIKARTIEKSELLGAPEKALERPIEPIRLANANIDGPSITLSFMADDKAYKEPIEALFRSLLLVLMDNGTAEYTFISRFFELSVASPAPTSPVLSPRSTVRVAPGMDRSNFPAQTTPDSVVKDVPVPIVTPVKTFTSKEQQNFLDGIWKQILGPVLDYCQAFTRGVVDPPPPVVPLLTMIRLLEDVLGEVQKRDCPPLETFTLGLRLSLWPTFQKDMNAQVESVKKLADGTIGGGFLSSKSFVKDATVQSVVHRYAVLFTSFIILTENEEETMIFSNLLRLRVELTRLIVSQSSKIKVPAQSASYQSSMYETLLQALSSGPRPTTHPKAQTEIAYWREREEEARRRIVSTRR